MCQPIAPVDDMHTATYTTVLICSLARFTKETGGMAFINEYICVVLVSKIANITQWRDIAVHAVARSAI